MPRTTRNNQISNLYRELPFYELTDFELKWECETCRQMIIDKMENNGFIEFLKNSKDYNDSKTVLENFKYFDTCELNSEFRKRKLIKIIHINARMLSKNRGKIKGFLETLDEQPDFMLLSEIGKEGYRFLQTTFPEYDHEYNVPLSNKYGGVAILADKNDYSITVKDELLLVKECTCTKCEFENKWIEVKINNRSYIIGCIYRHPNGNVEHFIESLSKTIEKIPSNCTCIIGGDININLIDIQNNNVSNYINELLSMNFQPNTFLPTRISDNSCTGWS